MGDKKFLQYAILKYLDNEARNLGEEQKESLEVAVQCMETVFNVSLDDKTYVLGNDLSAIFEAGVNALGHSTATPVTQSKPPPATVDKDKAEKHKTEGNELMKKEEYQKAMECYSEAIKADGTNAVYFCNRAAAHSKLDNHTEAISDCDEALTIDPNYSKAYGRKGLAHSAVNEHHIALECFRKALQLDPGNASYQQNIDIAEQKVREEGGMGNGGMPGGIPNLGGLNMGGMDFSNLFANPALMNIATDMMANPQMQEMMANFMNTAGGQAEGPQRLSGLLQAGQQLAQQMQQANPELVEQLRTQMRDGEGDGQEPDDSQQQ